MNDNYEQEVPELEIWNKCRDEVRNKLLDYSNSIKLHSEKTFPPDGEEMLEWMLEVEILDFYFDENYWEDDVEENQEIQDLFLDAFILMLIGVDAYKIIDIKKEVEPFAKLKPFLQIDQSKRILNKVFRFNFILLDTSSENQEYFPNCSMYGDLVKYVDEELKKVLVNEIFGFIEFTYRMFPLEYIAAYLSVEQIDTIISIVKEKHGRSGNMEYIELISPYLNTHQKRKLNAILREIG